MNSIMLEPVKSAGGNCFDDVIATLDTLYQRGFKLMYANALKFEWAPPSPGVTFGNRLFNGLADNRSMLGHFYGYTERTVRNPSPEEGLRLIRQQLGQGFPVILNIDTYYCSWGFHSGVHHFYLHVCIVVGEDSETGDLLVVDPFFKRDQLKLSRSQFSSGLLNIITLEPISDWQLDREWTLTQLCELLQTHLDTSADHFYRFADEIGLIDFDLESADGDSRFMASTFYLKLSGLQTARINYAILLEYVAETFGIPALAACIEDVRRLGNPWGTVSGLLAKLSFLPPERRDSKLMNSIGDKIRSAVHTERTVLQRVLSILSGDGQATDQPNVVQSQRHLPRTIVPVDIRNVCNVRGIENELGTADFDEDAHCYANDGLPKDGKLQYGDLSFIFPASQRAGDCDNVSCYGQSIPLPPDRYDGIAVLASGQYGGCVDQFTIEYEDGTNEQVQLGFADWWRQTPIAGEKIAWSAQLVSTQTGKHATLVHLFANEAPLANKKSEAVRLILPTMPNLHVFGISLWKQEAQ